MLVQDAERLLSKRPARWQSRIIAMAGRTVGGGADWRIDLSMTSACRVRRSSLENTHSPHGRHSGAGPRIALRASGARSPESMLRDRASDGHGFRTAAPPLPE